MNLTNKILQSYYKTGLRGNMRFTKMLSSALPGIRNTQVETEYGDVEVDLCRASGQAALINPYQTGEAELIKRIVRPNDVAYDIGAHWGIYSLLLSHLVGEGGEVHSFEPNSELYPYLSRTTASHPNIKTYQFAVSDTNDTLTFYVPEEASMGSLRDWTNGNVGKVTAVKVEAVRLDDLNLKQPDFIKCDIEGAEFSAFRGGVSVFNHEKPPVVLFEVIDINFPHFGINVAEFEDFFISRGYKLFNLVENDLEPTDTLTHVWANILAIPAHRNDIYKHRSLYNQHK